MHVEEPHEGYLTYKPAQVQWFPGIQFIKSTEILNGSFESDLKVSLQPPLTLQFNSAFPIRDIFLVSDTRSEGDTCHQLCQRSWFSLTKYRKQFEGFFWGGFPPVLLPS